MHCIARNTTSRITILVPIDLKTLVSYLLVIDYSTLNCVVLELQGVTKKKLNCINQGCKLKLELKELDNFCKLELEK